MTHKDLPQVFRLLRRHRNSTGPASVTEIAENHECDPYRVLISCLISLRTKDEVTAAASKRLFELVDRPRSMIRLAPETIEKAIFPCGFYRTKARTIREVSRDLIDRFGGETPARIEDLVTLKGVGRKTANLVRTLGHGKPGICVDVHVHRIANRWGLVRTANPDQTEAALRQILPRRYWIPINDLLVVYGQTVCRPISPHCSHCKIASNCSKVGVGSSR